jgi:hypothetical protein
LPPCLTTPQAAEDLLQLVDITNKMHDKSDWVRPILVVSGPVNGNAGIARMRRSNKVGLPTTAAPSADTRPAVESGRGPEHRQHKRQQVQQGISASYKCRRDPVLGRSSLGSEPAPRTLPIHQVLDFAVSQPDGSRAAEETNFWGRDEFSDVPAAGRAQQLCPAESAPQGDRQGWRDRRVAVAAATAATANVHRDSGAVQYIGPQGEVRLVYGLGAPRQRLALPSREAIITAETKKPTWAGNCSRRHATTPGRDQ